MDTELLFQKIYAFSSPLQEEKELLISLLKEEEYPAGRYIQRKGNPADKLWFIRSGFIMGYYPSEPVHQVCLFSAKGEFVTSASGFFLQSYSAKNLICKQESSLLCIRYKELQELRKIPSLSRAYEGIMAQYQAEGMRRIRSVLYDPPALRLQKLLNRYPMIPDVAKPIEISSYLGISRRTLYRLL
ncbi:Crp/Fnr family transcriptional regulator [Daejeonella sp. H1SJ63]|uniref:Crp/Fnr family transcriptional regulator n=1 Tax=Daejeonella sp. H1SJ63 TaxID=3034145 RepID=UPI0023EC3A7D|nr:Crp/Fnr family transcriptional regulator [Daejeonella sp. H1SJ63]